MQTTYTRTGFTLIELLIVITIIGTLATLLFANFSSLRERSRDARRKNDMDQVRKALRLYYNDFQRYPAGNASGQIAGCGAGTMACTWGSVFSITNGSVYMNELPVDPVTTWQAYAYNGPTGLNDLDLFCLRAKLENAGDPDWQKSQTMCSTICTQLGVTPAPNEFVVCNQ